MIQSYPVLYHHAAVLLAGIAAGAVSYAMLSFILIRAASPLNAADGTSRHYAAIRRRLKRAEMHGQRPLPKPRLVLFSASVLLVGAAAWLTGFAALIFAGFTPPSAFGGAMAMSLAVPALILPPWRRRRQRLFRQSFLGMLEAMVRATQAGLSFEQVLRVAAEGTREPARRHLLRFAGDIASGIPSAVAAARLYQDMPLAELRFFELVIALQQQTGGAGREALANLAASLRAEARFSAKLAALTAEAKMAAAIIGCLPFIVAAALSFAMPGYLDPLWGHPLGRLCLYASIAWMMLGILIIRIMARGEADT